MADNDPYGRTYRPAPVYGRGEEDVQGFDPSTDISPELLKRLALAYLQQKMEGDQWYEQQNQPAPQQMDPFSSEQSLASADRSGLSMPQQQRIPQSPSREQPSGPFSVGTPIRERFQEEYRNRQMDPFSSGQALAEADRSGLSMPQAGPQYPGTLKAYNNRLAAKAYNNRLSAADELILQRQSLDAYLQQEAAKQGQPAPQQQQPSGPFSEGTAAHEQFRNPPPSAIAQAFQALTQEGIAIPPGFIRGDGSVVGGGDRIDAGQGMSQPQSTPTASGWGDVPPTVTGSAGYHSPRVSESEGYDPPPIIEPQTASGARVLSDANSGAGVKRGRTGPDFTDRKKRSGPDIGAAPQPQQQTTEQPMDQVVRGPERMAVEGAKLAELREYYKSNDNSREDMHESLDKHVRARSKSGPYNAAAANYANSLPDLRRAYWDKVRKKSDKAQRKGTYGSGGYGYVDNQIVDSAAMADTRDLTPEEKVAILASREEMKNSGSGWQQVEAGRGRGPIDDTTVRPPSRSPGDTQPRGNIFRTPAGQLYVKQQRALAELADPALQLHRSMTGGVDISQLPINTYVGERLTDEQRQAEMANFTAKFGRDGLRTQDIEADRADMQDWRNDRATQMRNEKYAKQGLKPLEMQYANAMGRAGGSGDAYDQMERQRDPGGWAKRKDEQAQNTAAAIEHKTAAAGLATATNNGNPAAIHAAEAILDEKRIALAKERAQQTQGSQRGRTQRGRTQRTGIQPTDTPTKTAESKAAEENPNLSSMDFLRVLNNNGVDRMSDPELKKYYHRFTHPSTDGTTPTHPLPQKELDARLQEVEDRLYRHSMGANHNIGTRHILTPEQVSELTKQKELLQRIHRVAFGSSSKVIGPKVTGANVKLPEPSSGDDAVMDIGAYPGKM